MTVCGADEFGESVGGAIDTNNNMGKTHIVQDLPLPDFLVVDEASDSDIVVAGDDLRRPDDANEADGLVGAELVGHLHPDRGSQEGLAGRSLSVNAR